MLDANRDNDTVRLNKRKKNENKNANKRNKKL